MAQQVSTWAETFGIVTWQTRTPEGGAYEVEATTDGGSLFFTGSGVNYHFYFQGYSSIGVPHAFFGFENRFGSSSVGLSYGPNSDYIPFFVGKIITPWQQSFSFFDTPHPPWPIEEELFADGYVDVDLPTDAFGWTDGIESIQGLTAHN